MKADICKMQDALFRRRTHFDIYNYRSIFEEEYNEKNNFNTAYNASYLWHPVYGGCVKRSADFIKCGQQCPNCNTDSYIIGSKVRP